ncbi:hypothetical protein NM688_g4843 [Phlebia brevispora]|uniref:Uncharacterized protein n=1 Tax=Phlebia brevispora TaxID=194682 RepID=A0ACC1T1Y2_9APHY|nr:hypothetical protein NM688_g4843 [Phlebia brevispora]
MVGTSTGIMELPAEITESIIDCLYDDRDTLKNCALTYSSWLNRTRYHLHKSVTIDSNAADQKLTGYYSTGAAAYIQHLTLVAPPQPYGAHRRGSISQQAKPVWDIVSRFTEIDDLTLVFFTWRGAHKSYDRLAQIARHVTHLSLVIASFDDIADFLSFLSIFPRARDALSQLPLLEAPVGKYLRSVRFANTNPCPQVSEQLGKWLSSLPQQIVPKSSLTWTGAGSIHGLLHSLRGLGTNLAHIELDASSASRLAYEGDNGLRNNTSLETIAIKDLQYLARDEVQWLVVLLSQVAHPSFRKMTLVCTASCFEGVDEHSLEILDEFLSPPTFAGLEEVVLEFANTSRQVDLVDTIKRGLRGLAKRGVLHPIFPTHTEAEK